MYHNKHYSNRMKCMHTYAFTYIYIYKLHSMFSSNESAEWKYENNENIIVYIL